MMKANVKRIVRLFLLTLILGIISSDKVLAAKKISLSSKVMTVAEGKSKTLTVKNAEKTVAWKILSGKNHIVLEKKGKTAVRIKGTGKGTTRVQATIGKKKFICRVIVKKTTSVPNPANAPAGADKKDVEALKKLIIEQRERGAAVSEDLSSGFYRWEDGKLTGIYWEGHSTPRPNLSGKLDVSDCVNLMELDCANNRLSSVDVSKNTNLEKLWCESNQLSSLDVSKNANLKFLRCRNNQLSSLDVSKNTNLKEIWCKKNQLISLNLTGNTKLEYWECDDTVYVIRNDDN